MVTADDEGLIIICVLDHVSDFALMIEVVFYCTNYGYNEFEILEYLVITLSCIGLLLFCGFLIFTFSCQRHHKYIKYVEFYYTLLGYIFVDASMYLIAIYMMWTEQQLSICAAMSVLTDSCAIITKWDWIRLSSYKPKYLWPIITYLLLPFGIVLSIPLLSMFFIFNLIWVESIQQPIDYTLNAHFGVALAIGCLSIGSMQYLSSPLGTHQMLTDDE